MNFSVIVACTDDGIIGIDNKIPWYIPDDFKYFKKITSGINDMNELSINKNIVIMGSNTWKSIPDKYKPLSNRINIIISNTLKLENKVEDVYIYGSIEEAFKFIKTIHYNEIFIIGGEQIYNLVLNKNYIQLCKKIYMTRIKIPYELDKSIKTAMFPLDKLRYFSLDNISHSYYHNDIVYLYEIYNNNK